MPEVQIPIAADVSRRASFISDTIDHKSRTVDLSFSSETPCLRTLDLPEIERLLGTNRFYEILGHQPEEIDLTRLNAAGPLLFNHEDGNQIGTVIRAWVSGGKGRATVKFSRNSKQQLEDVQDGILKSVSVRGQIGAYSQVDDMDGTPVLRAVRWTPKEISMVTMPADLTVGVGRSEKHNSKQKDIQMITTDLKKDKNRLEALDAIERCEARGLTIPADTLRSASQQGWGYDKVLGHVMENQPTTNRGADTRVLDTMQRGERQEFSVVRMLNLLADNRPLDGFEGEVCREMEKTTGRKAQGHMIPADVFRSLPVQRNMMAGSFGDGGAVVSTDMGNLIEKLDNKARIEEAGATLIRGLVGNVSLPRQTSGATAHWLAEGASIPKSKLGTDDVAMTPHNIAAMIVPTRQLLKQGSLDVEAMIRSDILKRINLGIDKGALMGSGVAGEPKGLFTLDVDTSGINSLSFGGAPTWAKVVDFESLVDGDNALEGSLSYITSPLVSGKWKTTTKDTGSGRFIQEGGLANDYQVYRTNQLKGSDYANRVAFGAWSNLVLGLWGGIDVIVDPFTLADEGKVRIVASQLCDIVFRHPEAFAVSLDAGNQ